MSISVIIPNYNGQELLKKNFNKVVDELLSYRGLEIEVVVVDDYSEDKSFEELQKISSKIDQQKIKVRIFKNNKNLGFSSTINKGIKESNGSLLLLLNTDVIPERGFLIPLLSHFENSNCFAVGCMDKSIENGKSILRGRGAGKWENGFFVHRRGEVGKDNTLWVSGGSSMLKKSICEKLGDFDEIYNPFYWEDIDLSYRAIKSGYSIFFESKSIVRHEHEKGAIRKKYSDDEIKTIAYRNQFIFIWKNITDINLIISHLLWLPLYLLKALIKADWIFYRGFFMAVLLIPQIMSSRMKNKKLFLKKDSEVIESVQ